MKLKLEVTDISGKTTVGYADSEACDLDDIMHGIENLNRLNSFSMPVAWFTSPTKVYFNPKHIISITVSEYK